MRMIAHSRTSTNLALIPTMFGAQMWEVMTGRSMTMSDALMLTNLTANG